MKYIHILLALFFFCQLSSAQISVVKRTDLEINKKVGDNYNVLNLEENGILTIIESEEVLKGSKKEFIISKFDSTLQQNWTASFITDYSSHIGLHYQDGDYIYFLINKDKKEYDIFKLHIHSGMMVAINYEKIAALDIAHFVAVDNVLLFGGAVDGRPVVVHYAYTVSKPKILPIINTLKANINRLDICKADKSIFVLLTNNTNKKKESFYYNIFDIDGRLLTNTIVPYEKDYILYSFQPYLVSKNEQYLFGMYSLLAKDKAQGFYVAHIVNNEQDFIRFYDFIYFKNFFNYLGKRKEKTVNKIKEDREEGNIYKHDYNVLVRELQVFKDKILLVADSYSPLYRDMNSMNSLNNNWGVYNRNMSSMSNMFNGMNRIGQMSSYGGKVPSGYRYRHGIICAFDKKGKMIWDNSLEYKDLESNARLEPQIYVNTGTDSLTMLNFQNEKIYYKRTDKSMQVDEIKEVEIPSQEEAKATLDDRENESVVHWYGDYFIMYGIQKLKIATPSNPSRKVFYMSKLAYFPPKPEEKKAD